MWPHEPPHPTWPRPPGRGSSAVPCFLAPREAPARIWCCCDTLPVCFGSTGFFSWEKRPPGFRGGPGEPSPSLTPWEEGRAQLSCSCGFWAAVSQWVSGCVRTPCPSSIPSWLRKGRGADALCSWLPSPPPSLPLPPRPPSSQPHAAGGRALAHRLLGTGIPPARPRLHGTVVSGLTPASGAAGVIHGPR